MTNTLKSKISHKILSVMALAALLLGNAGFASNVFAAETVKVTIEKYIGDSKATAVTANNADFQMNATWNAQNIGPGNGQYALNESGFNGNPTPYQAITADMSIGADYSTNEITNGTVAATCTEGIPFALVGYTTGDTLAEAEAATPTLDVPTFTGLTTDKFVIVWNEDCSIPPPPPPQTSVKVTIDKFVQGAKATATSADNTTFPMSATWNAENIGAGTGEYTLSPTTETVYEAQTIAMDTGADYSTSEIVTTDAVGASCTEGKGFALAGYSTGNTYAEAVAATPTLTAPAFTDLQNDKYVIVWNTDCELPNGEIGGTVDTPDGALAVTSIDAVDTTATADGTFTNGWKYVFHITAPTSEQNLAMKFTDWLRTGGGGTIPVANDMRISSAQADNGGATVLLTAADTYSVPFLHMTSDLNPAMIGRQVEVTVEVAVPNSTPNGAYTTNYGVKTQ